jgi:hypothetical protein
VPRPEAEGGTGEAAREVGREVFGDIRLLGDMVEVVVMIDRSGWETELVHARLDILESLRWGLRRGAWAITSPWVAARASGPSPTGRLGNELEMLALFG